MTRAAARPPAASLPHPWRHPLARVRARLARWWQSRLPLSDSITLTQRNVYIMPTRAGLMLGVTLLVLLVAAINYQLNLGYLLTFLLAGSALVGMHVGHGTLRGLTLNLTAPEAIHLGSKAVFAIHLHNARRRTRFGIGLAVQGAGQWAWTDVAGQASATVQLAFLPERRGLHRLPTLTRRNAFSAGHLPGLDAVAPGRPGAGLSGARSARAAAARGPGP